MHASRCVIFLLYITLPTLAINLLQFIPEVEFPKLWFQYVRKSIYDCVRLSTEYHNNRVSALSQAVHCIQQQFFLIDITPFFEAWSEKNDTGRCSAQSSVYGQICSADGYRGCRFQLPSFGLLHFLERKVVNKTVTECWRIQVPHHFSVNLTFIEFVFVYSPRCKVEHLLLQSGHFRQLLCGNYSSFSFFSHSNILIIKQKLQPFSYHANSSTFSATYQIIDRNIVTTPSHDSTLNKFLFKIGPYPILH